jgi:guanosine-3',5'-bis(diphosphate) 3'-pyrophosphohydrolase
MALLPAIDFAARKHIHQRRKNPEAAPKNNHPIGVAMLLQEIGGITEEDVLVAAVLHDTVEDTKTTLDEIEANFGAKVRSIVAEVTDNKADSKLKRKLDQVANAPHKSHEAKLVKMADKLYNLGDLQRSPPAGWSTTVVLGYFAWAYEVYMGLIQAPRTVGPYERAEWDDHRRGINVNRALEAALNEVFSGVVWIDGDVFSVRAALPEIHASRLREYYAIMEVSK